MSDALPPEPDRRLARGVIVTWAAAGVPWGAGAIVVAAVLSGWPAVAAAVVVAVAAIGVLPVLRYRTWRYAVREEEIDLRHGAWVVRRTIVPMARVQHVDTARTPLGQMVGVAALTIHTAAGRHAIPGLESATADRLRTEIARRARVPDDV